MRVSKQDIIRRAREYYARALIFLRSKSRREWAIIGISFSLGAACFLLVVDLLFMPLYLLSGREIVVPDFIGKTWPEAHTLARKGQVLIARNGKEYHDTVEKEHIAMQRPTAGTRVKPGRRVFVVISKGPESVIVPDVVGKSRRDAELKLREAGLTMGEERVRTSRQFASGVVMRQYPKAGMQVQAGTEVGLHISR